MGSEIVLSSSPERKNEPESSSETTTVDKKPMKRSFFRQIFPHIAMLQISCFYLIIGGLIFRAIELNAAKAVDASGLSPVSSNGKTAYKQAEEIWTIRNSILFCFVTITTIGKQKTVDFLVS